MLTSHHSLPAHRSPSLARRCPLRQLLASNHRERCSLFANRHLCSSSSSGSNKQQHQTRHAAFHPRPAPRGGVAAAPPAAAGLPLRGPRTRSNLLCLYTTRSLTCLTSPYLDCPRTLDMRASLCHHRETRRGTLFRRNRISAPLQASSRLPHLNIPLRLCRPAHQTPNEPLSAKPSDQPVHAFVFALVAGRRPRLLRQPSSRRRQLHRAPRKPCGATIAPVLEALSTRLK